MRKRLHIALMAFATLTLLLSATLPHHHHHGAVCLVMAHCSSDGVANDRHTGHSDDGSKCFENGGAVLSIHKQHDCSGHPLPVLELGTAWVSAPLGWMNPQAAVSSPLFKARCLGGVPLTVCGLRAPPALVVA